MCAHELHVNACQECNLHFCYEHYKIIFCPDSKKNCSLDIIKNWLLHRLLYMWHHFESTWSFCPSHNFEKDCGRIYKGYCTVGDTVTMAIFSRVRAVVLYEGLAYDPGILLNHCSRFHLAGISTVQTGLCKQGTWSALRGRICWLIIASSDKGTRAVTREASN